MERKCFNVCSDKDRCFFCFVRKNNIFIYFLYFRLQKSLQTLPGDTLMVSAFVSYVGYFTKIYRQELIQNSWLPFFKEVKVTN